MRESVFQSEITKSVAELLPDWFYFKIPDAPIFGSEATFKRKPMYKPFDCFLTSQGRFLAIECKMIKGLTSWPFSDLLENQEQGLNKVVESGGSAGILLNVRNNALPANQQKKYGIKAINKAIWMPINVWTLFREKIFSDRKSIPIGEILINPWDGSVLVMERVRNEWGEYLWPANELINHVFEFHYSTKQELIVNKFGMPALKIGE